MSVPAYSLPAKARPNRGLAEDAAHRPYINISPNLYSEVCFIVIRPESLRSTLQTKSALAHWEPEVIMKITICPSTESIEISDLIMHRVNVLEVTKTQVCNLEINIIWRCPTSTENKYVRRFNVLMPST